MPPIVYRNHRATRPFGVASGARRGGRRCRRAPAFTPEVGALAALSLGAAVVSASSSGVVQAVAAVAALVATGLGQTLIPQTLFLRSVPSRARRR